MMLVWFLVCFVLNVMAYPLVNNLAKYTFNDMLFLLDPI